MSKKSALTTIAEIAGILSVIIAIIFGINQWKKSDIDKSSESKTGLFSEKHSTEKVKDFIDDYFNMLMRRDYSELNNYFNFPVERFYDFTNVGRSDITNQLINYNSKWKISKDKYR